MTVERVVCTCDHHDDRHATGGCVLCPCSRLVPRRPPSAHTRENGQPKLRYATRADAKAAGKRYPDHRRMRAYECPSCGGWHLSSSQRRPAE